jgi:hypothetical protein
MVSHTLIVRALARVPCADDVPRGPEEKSREYAHVVRRGVLLSRGSQERAACSRPLLQPMRCQCAGITRTRPLVSSNHPPCPKSRSRYSPRKTPHHYIPYTAQAAELTRHIGTTVPLHRRTACLPLEGDDGDRKELSRARAAYDHAMVWQPHAALPLDDLPSRTWEETIAERASVAVGNGSRTLVVSRVQPSGGLSRLKRWLKALDPRLE